jgi:bifunctional DNA-binding transcriptional regulator/antitoxin component of YhaV-PrlF toxin-antitoxin module
MKHYQVTRKLQITVPQVLAKELRIRPGDAVVFEKVGRAMLMRKVGMQVRGYDELKQIVEALAEDMDKVGKHVRVAERALAANLSRHISS